MLYDAIAAVMPKTSPRTRRLAGRLARGSLTMAVLGLVAGTAVRHHGYAKGCAFAVGPSSHGSAQQQAAVVITQRQHLRGATEAAPAAGIDVAWRTAAFAMTCGLLATAAARSAGLARQAARTLKRATVCRALPQGDDNRKATPIARGAVDSPGREELLTTDLVNDVNPEEGPQGTYKVGIDFKNWLKSAEDEIQVGGLTVEGTLPVWLRGSLVHAGPAKFEFGDDEFVDWVDGQAMLFRLRILGDGICEYRNRWLDTSNHRAHREAGRIAVRETCSRPSLPNFLDRFLYMFSPPNNENGNLHVSQMCGGKRCVSMSVGSTPLEFSLTDMETLGKVPFQDELCEGGPLIFHAEPHVDPRTGEWVTCAIQLKISSEHVGLKPEYVVFAVAPTEPGNAGAPLKRRLITRIATEYPSPVHTISLTERYIVMIQIPYPLNWEGMINAESKWLLTGKYEGNLNDYNTWMPELRTKIRVIDRVTGEQHPVFDADPFFFFHTINCFEEKGGPDGNDDIIYLDVVCYNEPPVGFPLRQARSGDVEDWRGGGGEVRRFGMNMTTGECIATGWPDNCFDEPKINPKVDMQRHRYSWGVIDDNGMLRLTKQDHDTHEVIKWQTQDVSRELPWQPVFVPEPYSEEEDAGCLLSFVRDQPTGNTFCVVLDSKTLEEHGRIHFPEGHHVPLHGHGHFMQGQF